MMTIVQKPSPINLSGNLPSFIMFSDDPFNFVIKKGNISLLSGSYTPGGDRKVTIDVKDVIEFSLSFQFRDILETYTQDTLIDTFYAYINDELICNFEVIKGGISNFGMTPQTFLQQHFLTWQPREKRVSYSSPEYLTYYAVTDCRIKLKAYMSTVDAIEMVISELQQGKVYTIPVMYAVVAGKLNAYPAYYDIWVESADGSVRYSYIQRFVYEQGKSEQEEYIIFENSLGGVDCFRAYGNTVFNADNTHNIAIIDDQLNEYRIDTEYKYTKNTGYLTKYEAEWLKDFFPSTGKYIFRNNILRKIVLTEDNVSSSEQESVNSYEFTYRYADDNIYLNLPVYQNSKKLISPMSLNVDNVEKSLGLEPRLAEFPMQKLSEGSLIPVQEPFSERWNATNAGAIANYIIEKINSLTDGRLLDNRFKGYYLTETSLKESYPNPLKGDSAWVGEPFPGVVYTVENGKWKTSGKAPDFGDINLEDYATKEDLAAQDSKLTELSSLKNQFAVNAGLLPVTVDFEEKTLSWEEGGFIIYGNGKNSSMAVLAGEQQFESTNESSGIQYITYNTQDGKYHFYKYSDDFDRGKNAFVAVIAGSSKKVLYSIVTIKDENDNILFEDSESLKEKIKPLKVDVDSLKGDVESLKEEGYIFKNFNPENSIQKTINQSIKKLAISNYVEGLKILVTRNNATVTDVSIGTGTSSTDIVEMFHFIFARTSQQSGIKSMTIENEYGKAYIVVDFNLLNGVNYTNLYADDYILSEWNCSTNKWGESTKSRIIVVDEKGSGDYTSLQDAIDNAEDSKTNPRTILVLPGTYVMPAYDSTTRYKCYNRYLTIIGTDKNQCIIRNDVGYYNTNPWQDNAPIKMQGNVYLERLTVICTDDNFVLPEGVEESYEGRYHKAYCVHFDHECEAETIAEINNCRLINNHFACVGIGTRNTIKIVDTELEMTLYETFPSNLYGNDVGVIAGHDGNTDSRQTLFIKNCVIKNENGNYSVTMSNAYGKNVDISLLFNYANKPLKLTGDNMVKTEMCYGNNQDTFNV